MHGKSFRGVHTYVRNGQKGGREHIYMPLPNGDYAKEYVAYSYD